MFKLLTKIEKTVWLASIIVIIVSFLLSGKFNFGVLIASLVGATALIFVSKGEPIGQILTVFFALIYGYVSFKYRYWGELITYLGMTAPSALASVISWYKNPYKKGKTQVRVKKLSNREKVFLLVSSIFVTFIFYYLLKLFNTPNLIVSTISVFTSYLASVLTFFRSPFYALAYSANDIVLIILWVMASFDDISYISMVICFVIFLINDLYGYYNWKRIQAKQSEQS